MLYLKLCYNEPCHIWNCVIMNCVISETVLWNLAISETVHYWTMLFWNCARTNPVIAEIVHKESYYIWKCALVNCIKSAITRVFRGQHSSSLESWSDEKTIFKYKRLNANLNIAVNDRVWPDFDVGRMSNWGMGYILLKHLPLDWYGQNMKAISYMLNPLGCCGWTMKAISYILQQSCTLFKT